MPLITIQDYPVHNKYWYIVDFRNLLKAKLLPHYYLSLKAARKSIKLNFLGKRKARYKVMKGNEVKEFFLNYLMGEGTGNFVKYAYPIHAVTSQSRKDHRTVMRRRLRRMGLLTLVKVKWSVKKKPQIIKPIINTQIKASKNTRVIRVIQIERKPSRYYYVVLSKELSKNKGKLFKLNTLKYDQVTGEIKQVQIHTLRTDFLTPYLIQSLQILIHEKIKEGKRSAGYFRGYEGEFGIKLVTG